MINGPKIKRWVLIGGLVSLIMAFFIFDLGQLLTLDNLKSGYQRYLAFYQASPGQTLLIYFVVYIIVVALSLPGGGIMTLAGGALFGVLAATPVIVVAATIGATIAFWVSRYLFHDALQTRFGHHLHALNEGIERDGGLYLFSIRMIPVFPFFIVNALMGLTPITTWNYVWATSLGMIPATVVFANAGTQLASLESVGDILSLRILLSFALLAVLPWLLHKLLGIYKSRRALRGYAKPKRFDYNLMVIGAGSAGLVSAYIAATLKSRVALIEQGKMGGDCLNTGCVPSKAFIRSAKLKHEIDHAEQLGLSNATATTDFKAVMDRVHSVIKQIAPHDSIERYRKLGVDCLQGTATITSPWQVKVNDQTYSTRAIVIATGASPFVPPIPGINDLDYLTSDNLWQLTEQPGTLAILGGGPIGCELAQSFQRLGTQVVQVEMMPGLLGREDADVSEFIASRLLKEGVDLRLNHRAVGVEKTNDGGVLLCDHNGTEVRIKFDRLLVAIGRKANLRGIGLDQLGIEVSERGTIVVNAALQTRIPTIYAAGDCVGPYQFTHAASHQAWYASVNALFKGLKRFCIDYSIMPWVTFTDPEVARVGLNETEAVEQGIDFEVTRYELSDLDRAITDNHEQGFVKVITRRGKDRVLGATIIGAHAGELITEFVTAMKHDHGLNKILGTIHSYPTLSEANKFLAGNWKRNHAPLKLLALVEKYNRWRRN